MLTFLRRAATRTPSESGLIMPKYLPYRWHSYRPPFV